MFQKVLIANRGEIARRVVRTLKKLGIASVAVYSDSDALAPHVTEADEAVHIGADPATNSYLLIEKIVAAALATGVDAVHPGYGFLAESQDFARALAEVGVTLIGPDTLALEVMGDKARSRDHVSAHGVPVVPGFNAAGMSDTEILRQAEKTGFPLLIKPSAGGGGKGMEIATDAAALPSALAAARRVARSAFGDETMVLERLIAKPRHIEVQIFGDKHGHVIALGERECTLQRRHQKVIEEAPSLAITAVTRQELFAAAVLAAKSVAYVGAGTVEFLIDADNPSEFFFIEMNTRLQVEHPVTEAVTGLDLVELQLLVAAGADFAELVPEQVPVTGHAVEARIYAESPTNDFLPSVGKILRLEFGVGSGSAIRVDSAVEEGSSVSPFYDPMIAKMIAHGDTREEALANLDQALAKTVILGVETNIAFLRQLLANEDVREARLDTGLIDRLLPIAKQPPSPAQLTAAALAVSGARERDAHAQPQNTHPQNTVWQSLTGWRITGQAATRVGYLRDEDGVVYEVRIHSKNAASLENEPQVAFDGERVWVSAGGHSLSLQPLSRREKTLAAVAQAQRAPGAGNPECVAPMPGAVVALHVADGQEVAPGDALVSVEAMKMEHQVTAQTAGTVRLKVRVGEQVQRGTIVAVVAATETSN